MTDAENQSIYDGAVLETAREIDNVVGGVELARMPKEVARLIVILKSRIFRADAARKDCDSPMRTAFDQIRQVATSNASDLAKVSHADCNDSRRAFLEGKDEGYDDAMCKMIDADPSLRRARA